MPINEVKTGDLLTSTKWNELVKEINAKANRVGDTFTGALTVADKLTVKNVDISDNLTVTNAVSVGSLTVTNKINSLTVANAAVDNLTVTNKINSLTVANAAVDNLTVTNKINSLTVANAAVDNLTVLGKTQLNGGVTITGSSNIVSILTSSLEWTNLWNNINLKANTGNVASLSGASFSGAIAVTGWGNMYDGSFYYHNNGGHGTSKGASDFSIYASKRIAASEFDAFSDARIKQKLHISNAAEDLATLMQLKVTDYTMIDTVSNGNRVSKKLIAQEAAAVYPNAVSYTTGFIPNIYQLAPIENGFVTLSNPDLTIGDKVRLIFEDQTREVRVTGMTENGFSVLADQPKSQLPNGRVFVFGKEVHDFHTIDYDAITMLNTSATQAVVKQINGLETKHAALKARFEALETSLKSFQS